jgi:hypothetical protein
MMADAIGISKAFKSRANHSAVPREKTCDLIEITGLRFVLRRRWSPPPLTATSPVHLMLPVPTVLAGRAVALPTNTAPDLSV